VPRVCFKHKKRIATATAPTTANPPTVAPAIIPVLLDEDDPVFVGKGAVQVEVSAYYPLARPYDIARSLLRGLDVALGPVVRMIGLVLLAPGAVVITTAQSESQLNIYSGFRSPVVWYMVPVPQGTPLIAVNMSERGLENWDLPVSRTTKRVDEIAGTSGQKCTTISCTAYLVLVTRCRRNGFDLQFPNVPEVENQPTAHDLGFPDMV
jgi:hypothetical protein